MILGESLIYHLGQVVGRDFVVIKEDYSLKKVWVDRLMRPKERAGQDLDDLKRNKDESSTGAVNVCKRSITQIELFKIAETRGKI